MDKAANKVKKRLRKYSNKKLKLLMIMFIMNETLTESGLIIKRT